MGGSRQRGASGWPDKEGAGPVSPKDKEEEVAEAGRFQEAITPEEIKSGKHVTESLEVGHHHPAQGTLEEEQVCGGRRSFEHSELKVCLVTARGKAGPRVHVQLHVNWGTEQHVLLPP